MAGKVLSDLQEIIRRRPKLFAELIRHMKEVPDRAIMGLPRFDYYDGDAKVIAGAEKLESIKSAVQVGREQGSAPLPGNESVDVRYTIPLRKAGSKRVREMSDWLRY